MINRNQNRNWREFLLFIVGVYGERLYIWLDILFTQIPILKNIFFLSFFYLLIIVITTYDG